MDNSKKTKRKILVTQALPYANAPLHLGHILEAVQTDIWTRFQNFNGNECLFFCADDTHGTPVMLKANEMGIKPEELISDVYKDHKSSYELYGINFSNFYSTHSDENRKYSEYIYECAKNNNLISKANIELTFSTFSSCSLKPTRLDLLTKLPFLSTRTCDIEPLGKILDP